MKKRILKKSEVLREGYVKGLKKAQQLIKESLGENPFEGTDEWYELDDEEREMVSSYLGYFDAEQTLQQTLEEAQERYVGTFDDWEDFGRDEFVNGGLDTQWLLDMNCIDWEQVGYILSNDYHMDDNGMTFRAF